MFLGGRFAAVVLIGVTTLCGCSSASNSPGASPPGLPCPAKSTGDLCLHLNTDDMQLRDALGYLVTSPSALRGATWRLVLSDYRCDPGTGPQPACSPSNVFPGPARRQPPPRETFCRDRNGTSIASPLGCDTAVVMQVASAGDWSGLNVPVSLKHDAWLCVSEQFRSNSGWGPPPPASAPEPPRACSSVPS